MSDFSIMRDWKKINWKATLQYNVFRSMCATPIWFLLVLLVNKHFVWQMILFPIIYFAFWLPLGLVCGWLAQLGVPFVWMLSRVSSLVIVLGDPVVWTVHKIKPDLVPVAEPKFLDFHLITFATNEPDVIPPCNYEGRIVSDENVQFMSEVFPMRRTLFIIKPDWSVETLKDPYFGFVDINGIIRKGRMQKGIDPRETDIGEMVAYIGHDVCYNPQQERIGQYDFITEPEHISRDEISYVEESRKKTLDQLDQVSEKRKLVKSDFPSGSQLSSFAGHVEALNNFKFLDIDWSQKEMVFDIDYRGYIKTPYNDFFGYIDENGDIMCDANSENTEPFKVATIKGHFCYANNQKIGHFVVQTD